MTKQQSKMMDRVWLVAGGAVLATVGLGLGVSSTAKAQSGGPGAPVFIGEQGKLGGPMTGYAWVAASAGTTVSSPSPCNENGCFKETRGQLCTRGVIPALQCTGRGTSSFSCDWKENWGVVLGMNTTSSAGPWDTGAPSSVSVAYRGGRATYRLNAHVSGEPESKVYCIDAYQSGQVADARAFRSSCWSESGEALGNFQKVDKLSLEVMPAESAVSFDYCVTSIAVNGPAAASRAGGPDAAAHVVIEDNGKLGGPMSGYSWVAGGAGATFTAPHPCNEYGCFSNTQGRLCAQGNIAPLACTGQGTPQLSCNWAANWGAMIGLNANLATKAWGPSAPSSVALRFSGPPADYRLMAHVAGDPDTTVYCIDHYQSGQAATAQMLKSRCWADSGEALASYGAVDKIGLQVMSAEAAVPIDVCISDVALW